jgi:hypothetical protein
MTGRSNGVTTPCQPAKHSADGGTAPKRFKFPGARSPPRKDREGSRTFFPRSPASRLARRTLCRLYSTTAKKTRDLTWGQMATPRRKNMRGLARKVKICATSNQEAICFGTSSAAIGGCARLGAGQKGRFRFFPGSQLCNIVAAKSNARTPARHTENLYPLPIKQSSPSLSCI